MKQYIIKSLAFASLAVILFAACKKDLTLFHTEQQDLSNKSMVKVYSSTLGANRNYVYFDNLPVTGAGIAYGNLFPSVSFYAAIRPGNLSVEIRDTLLTTTQNAIRYSSNFQAGKYYTIFTYDTLNAAKQVTVEDKIVVPNDTTARIRFANMIYSKTAVPAVDIYSIKQKANIFTNVPVTSVTDFIPFASDISDTLFVRATGTTIDLTQLNAIVAREKRSYTVVFRGVYQLTTGTLARTLTSFTTY
jgi:hypothetical protein